jgi:dCMP deaminase
MEANKWDIRFLQLAELVASWSKDPSTKVGSVIVDEQNRVLSVGFNGFPRGIEDNPELYQDREKKYERVLHAEQNALHFSFRLDLRGCTLYTYPLLPCNRCALEIIQRGITRVVSVYPTESHLERWRESFDLTKDLLNQANVQLVLI